MKRIYLIVLGFAMLFSFQSCEGLEGVELTDAEIIAGLKEALTVASDSSVTNAQKEDGYAGNSKIRIPFPQDVDYVETAVNGFTILGQPVGQTAVSSFVLKLNRAAEDAADRALPILVDAIVGITIVDGLEILTGHDSAATGYLKTNTFDDLKSTFKPDIETSLATVGAQSSWNTVTQYYNTLTGNTVNTDLADYTTDKALSGLFTLVSQEEKLIRDDPAARVTDLLAKVFGEQD